MKKPVCVRLWIVYWLADSAVAYWWYFSLIFTETTRVRVRKSILYWKYQDQRATKSRKDSHAGNLCGGHILFMPQWGVLSSTMPWPVSFLFKLGWGRELKPEFLQSSICRSFWSPSGAAATADKVEDLQIIGKCCTVPATRSRPNTRPVTKYWTLKLYEELQ